jgi:Mrp family chromosome partitioning ATPase
MADVRERFDLVILDTSPLSFSNDPYLIQPYSDGIILVTRPNYTKGTLLGEIIDQLLEDGLELIGGAINGADIPVKISTSESAMPLEMPITSPAGGASATSAKLDELSMSVGKS